LVPSDWKKGFEGSVSGPPLWVGCDSEESLRRVLPERIWYDLEAEAKTLGKEPGAVIATRLVDALERAGR